MNRHDLDFSSVVVVNDLKENLVKSKTQNKVLEESIFAKDKQIKELESKNKTCVTDTLNAKRDVETKDKIILS